MCVDQFDEDVKDEPLSEEDFKAQAKDRIKKDNHNMSKLAFIRHFCGV